MNRGVAADEHTVAQAAGFERWFRQRVVDTVNRVVVALILLGGLAVALSAPSRDAMIASAISAVGVAVVVCVIVVVRYVHVRHQLTVNTADEVARLRSKPGKRLQAFIEGGVTPDPELSGNALEKSFDPDALKNYGQKGDAATG